MTQKNLNYKCGKCCNCPALTTGKQFFTNFESSRYYNNDLKKKLNLKDSHSYRQNLQTNATLFMLDENLKLDGNQCTSNNKYKFNIDLSKYSFSNRLVNEYNYPSIPNNYITKSQKQDF
jgi:hypothetical protein